LKLGESAVMTFRRMSLRVVNLAGTGMADQLRLNNTEDEDQPLSSRSKKSFKEEEDIEEPDLKQALPIRGRTLGFLGETNRLRHALFNFLVHPFTEPMILILIIINAAILTVQAFPSITLPTANGPTLPPKVQGYFHAWEDYVLFGLFIVFT
jgi:hypothetical protein